MERGLARPPSRSALVHPPDWSGVLEVSDAENDLEALRVPSG